MPIACTRSASASSARATATRSGPWWRITQPDMQTSQAQTPTVAVVSVAGTTRSGPIGSSAQTETANTGKMPAGPPTRVASDSSRARPATTATTRMTKPTWSVNAAVTVPTNVAKVMKQATAPSMGAFTAYGALRP